MVVWWDGWIIVCFIVSRGMVGDHVETDRGVHCVKFIGVPGGRCCCCW